METQAVEIIETEIQLPETMSYNHSRLIHRLSLLLSIYEDQYDVLPELEFELSTGRLKPDMALLPKQAVDWELDIVRFPHPPVTAIEILSPTQTMDGLVLKIRQGYFSSGVQSAWLVLPTIRTISVYLPNQPVTTFNGGILRDPATGVELALDALFG